MSDICGPPCSLAQSRGVPGDTFNMLMVMILVQASASLADGAEEVGMFLSIFEARDDALTFLEFCSRVHRVGNCGIHCSAVGVSATQLRR